LGVFTSKKNVYVAPESIDEVCHKYVEPIPISLSETDLFFFLDEGL